MGFSLVLMILLGLGGLAFVAVPLQRGRYRMRREAERRAALDEKAAALQLLADLDLDRRTGKLVEEDYVEQRAAAEARAIAALKDLDAFGWAAGGDPTERMIQLERARIRRERQG